MDTQSTVKAQRQREAGRILARLRKALPSILARYPVDAAYVYGSAARGTVTPLSDVDVALLLDAPLPPCPYGPPLARHFPPASLQRGRRLASVGPP